jgi:hypothetical protein
MWTCRLCCGGRPAASGSGGRRHVSPGTRAATTQVVLFDNNFRMWSFLTIHSRRWSLLSKTRFLVCSLPRRQNLARILVKFDWLLYVHTELSNVMRVLSSASIFFSMQFCLSYLVCECFCQPSNREFFDLQTRIWGLSFEGYARVALICDVLPPILFN